MGRLREFDELLDAYQATGEMKYAEKLDAPLVSWLKQHPVVLWSSGPLGSWSSLEAAARCVTPVRPWMWNMHLMWGRLFVEMADCPAFQEVLPHNLWAAEREVGPTHRLRRRERVPPEGLGPSERASLGLRVG